MRDTTTKRDARRAATVLDVADITGVSPRQVYRVLGGECENETVLLTYTEIEEKYEGLLNAIKQAVPFNTTAAV